MNTSTIHRARTLLSQMLPEPGKFNAREKLRVSLGALLGVLVTAAICQGLLTHFGFSTWMVAPMGATAAILFVLPSSPMAKIWPVLVGNTVSALIGVGVVHLIGSQPYAPAIAVSAAIAAMLLLRCLHPPAAAAAMLMVLTRTLDGVDAVVPIALNSAILLFCAKCYHWVTLPRQVPTPAAPSSTEPSPGPRFTTADLDAALAHFNQVVDIDRKDLATLLSDAELHAWRRTLGELRCQAVMSRDLVTTHLGDSLAHAWNLLHQHSIKALPVVDKGGTIVGIVTLADFVKRLNTDQVLRGEVREIVTRKVRVASENLRVLDLLPLFSEGSHHHLPVVNSEQALVGMITQSDVVRALHRAVS